MPRTTRTTSETTKRKTRTTARKEKASEVTKEQAQKYLSQVPEQNAFWCNNGAILRDMRELKDALTFMSEETYTYHSNAFKKDFSNWIRDVVGDEKLAKELESAPSRQDALTLVEQRCSLLMDQSG